MSDCADYNLMLRRSTVLRLCVLFGSFFIGMLVVSGLSVWLKSLTLLTDWGEIIITSVAQCVVAFCLPAWLTAKFSGEDPFLFLGLRKSAPPKVYAAIIAVFLMSMPAMNLIIEWNASIKFPEWASGLEQTLRDWESSSAAVTDKIFGVYYLWELLINVLVVGLLTGFSEEMFFRGGLQTTLRESNVGKHAAVWLTALVFSAMHFQFFGFFPRLLMGVYFGYLLVWTGSIWPPIFAHALNNSVVVLVEWRGCDNDGMLSAVGLTGGMENTVLLVASFIGTVVIFTIFRKYFFEEVV